MKARFEKQGFCRTRIDNSKTLQQRPALYDLDDLYCGHDLLPYFVLVNSLVASMRQLKLVLRKHK